MAEVNQPFPEHVAVTVTESRFQALRRFAAQALADDELSIEPASADASFRSYWRVGRGALSGGGPSADPPRSIAPSGAPTGAFPRSGDPTGGAATCIIMDAPPDREDIGPWLEIAGRLRSAGLHAPAVFAEDRAQGFVLIEDLGARTYLPELDEAQVDALYADALDALIRMQTAVDVAGLPAYDRERLITEMELMPEWLLKRHFGFTPSCEDWDIIEAAFTFLVHAALEQPRAFVHRDYHSRNLLKCRDSSFVIRDSTGQAGRKILANPGIIDFQDAVIGPVTYDLVSLLRDCYVEWDAERVDGWMESHRERLRHAHLIGPEIDITRFRRWFDPMGMQRHIKVLGIFCRLWYRDGKAQYLADLPRVWHYTLDIARRYPELVDFAELLERARGERDIALPNPADHPA